MEKTGTVIFGGTTEGRILCEFAAEHGIPVHVCVTTEYGEDLLPDSDFLQIHRARMDENQIRNFVEEHQIHTVIDATHPYAREVTENIKKAVASDGQNGRLQYFRVVRKQEETEQTKPGQLRWFDTLSQIVEVLNKEEGDVFVTTGSKEIRNLLKIRDAKKRLVLRILDVGSIRKECIDMGFDENRILAKRGPFSYEENRRDFEEHPCSYLITKESGREGGFSEKIRAAADKGMKVLVLRRPVEQGITLREMLKKMENNIRKKVWIVGIGMDGCGTITLRGREVIRDAGLLIGAGRMLKAVEKITADQKKETFVSYESDEIVNRIRQTDQTKIAVCMSGDGGFYSGCKKLLQKMGISGEEERMGLREDTWMRFGEKSQTLSGKDNLEVEVISGISSPVYLAGRLGISWQDMHFVSLHGTNANVITEIHHHHKTFLLLGGDETAGTVCRKMTAYGFSGLQVVIGENLAMPEEKIISGYAGDFVNYEEGGLQVMLVMNSHPEDYPAFGIDDELFFRGKVPMTKSEVRSVILSKLRIRPEETCLDLGCGTGSVSVEMAGFAMRGKVYAVDHNPEAIRLTGENAIRFKRDNIILVEGDLAQPQVLRELPRADAVFIGGGGRNLCQILGSLIEKNPDCRIVMTAVSLETLESIRQSVRVFGLEADITQAAVTRTKKTGDYTMFTAQNPVFIACI